MDCPQCDCHHDGPYLHCDDCLRDFRRMLESGDNGVVSALTDYMQDKLTKKEPVKEIECPKCMHEFEI